MNNDEWQTLKLESYDISVAFMERKDTIEDLFKSKKVVYEKLCSIWTDGEYYFQLHSTVFGTDELIKIASSVK